MYAKADVSNQSHHYHFYNMNTILFFSFITIVTVFISLLVHFGYMHSLKLGDYDASPWPLTMMLFVILLFAVFTFGAASKHADVEEHMPKAIDVYRGRTTLKCSIVDGEVLDSTVIFKNYNINN